MKIKLISCGHRIEHPWDNYSDCPDFQVTNHWLGITIAGLFIGLYWSKLDLTRKQGW